MKSRVTRHNRFYIPTGDWSEGAEVRFSKRESRHMLASLRVRKGDLVSATDGEGWVYRVLVEEVTEREVVGRVEASIRIERAGPPVYLFQAVIKPSKMELLVEKATELGVWGVTPVRASRSKGSLGSARLDRLRKAAVEAMKQSLGSYLPEIGEAVTMDEALESAATFDLVLMGREEEEGAQPLYKMLEGYRGEPIALWIGPEGGFDETETQALYELGAKPYTLGPLRLKSETAAIASLAVLRTLAYR